MKKLVVILVAFAFVAAIAGSAHAESCWATKQMPTSSVATSLCGGDHFVFQGGTDPMNSVNLDKWGDGAHCGNPVIMGALLCEKDNIVAGHGPCGKGFMVVLGFDKPLFDCDEVGSGFTIEEDLLIWAIGPGWCVQQGQPGDVKPAKVYISSHDPCCCDGNCDMGYDHDVVTPLPWYYDDSNWTYVGTIIPSEPPCTGTGGVVVPTPIDFQNVRTTDGVVWNAGFPPSVDPNSPYASNYTYGWYEDTGAPADFDTELGGKVCWVKIVFADLTTYDDYPSVIFEAKTTGITPVPASLPVVWGDGKAKFIDAVEGLYPAPTGDINADGFVNIRDFNILKDHWGEKVCP